MYGTWVAVMSKKKKIILYIGLHFILSIFLIYLSPRFDLLTLFLFLMANLTLCLSLLREERKSDEEINDEMNELLELLHLAYDEFKDYDFKDKKLTKYKDEIRKIISEKDEINKQELKSKESLKTYMEDIAHQIKTPLTGILLILDLMEADDDKNEYTSIIRHDINRLYKLTDILLKMSSIDSGLIKMKKELFSVKELLSEISLNLASYFIASDLKIKVIGVDFNLRLDRSWTLEAIFNIMKNALEASAEKGIEVELKSNKIYQSIVIRDFGQGIDKKILPKIYKRFYKADPHSKGFGMGLSMSKTIIQKQNGDLLYQKGKESNSFEIRFYL